MITGRKHPQEALGLAMTAATALERKTRLLSPERLSVYGALHLAAATAAAASFDRATAQSLPATARGIADRIGEANHMGTAFGPVNVAIHAISASLKLALSGHRRRGRGRERLVASGDPGTGRRDRHYPVHAPCPARPTR